MNLVEIARKLEEDYKLIPFNDYRKHIGLLVPYFDLPNNTQIVIEDVKEPTLEQQRTDSILSELYRFEKFEEVYLYLLGYVQGKEKNFPSGGIWDLGTNLLPHYANNFAIPDGKYRDEFPAEIRKNFSDLLKHRLGPKGGKIRTTYALEEIPRPQHMHRIINLIGVSLALFKDYMNGLIEQSPSSSQK